MLDFHYLHLLPIVVSAFLCLLKLLVVSSPKFGKDVKTMKKENNFLSENNCKDIVLKNRSQYLYILNTIKKDTAKIIIVQVTGEDKEDSVVNTAKKLMTLEKREKVHKWLGTIQRGTTAVQYTFLKTREFFDFLSSFESFFIVISENPYIVKKTDFGLDDIAFEDSNGDLLFYTTTHEGYAYLNNKYLKQGDL